MTIRSNEQWLAELRDTDHPDTQAGALEALRERLKRGIYYYLSRERSDMARLSEDELTQMAEDFAQDSVLRVLDNLDSFRGDSQFTTWALKIAVRVTVSELRRARYRDFSLDDLTTDGELMVHLTSAPGTSKPPTAPERATEREDVITIIDQAFKEVLTERQRIALEAVSLRGIPMDVIAEELGTNRNALYKLLHDARKKMKTHLEEQGLSIEYVMGLFG